MTVRELLASVNGKLAQTGRLRYKVAATTSAGAADGTTLVSTSVGGATDGWNNAEVRITSGSAAGERRRIADFATSTITVFEPFSVQIITSVDFEIGEAGFVTDAQHIESFTECQDEVIVLLPPEAFPGHTELIELAAASGVSAALPANLAVPPKALRFRNNVGSEFDMIILPLGERDRFHSDAFLGATVDDMIAIFEGGLIKYRPSSATGTIVLPVVPKFDAVTFAGGSQLPSYLHILQIYKAVADGWLVKQQPAMSQAWEKKYYDHINSLRQQYGYSTLQSEPDE